MTIAEWRNAKKMTQKELADALATTQTNISKWETGRQNPSKATLQKFAAAFGCKVEEIDIDDTAPKSMKRAGDLANYVPAEWWDKYTATHIGETVELLKKAYDAGFADGRGAP